MITIDNAKEQANRLGSYRTFEFRGLSTDEKPTDVYGGVKIGNGSVFIELDTEAILFYDEENGDWVGGGE